MQIAREIFLYKNFFRVSRKTFAQFLEHRKVSLAGSTLDDVSCDCIQYRLRLPRMPKKNKTASAQEVSHERQDEAFVERQSAGDESVPAQSSSRLSLPLTAEGTVDWDRTRDSQKEKFTAAVLNSPETLEMIGLAAEGTQQQGWSAESIHFGLDLMSSVNAFAFRMLSQKIMGTKVDGDISSQCFAFEEDDYPKLIPPAQRIADRFVHVDPKYQDMVLFCTAMLAIVGKQAQNALAMQGERDEKKKPKGEIPTIHPKPVAIRPTQTGGQS